MIFLYKKRIFLLCKRKIFFLYRGKIFFLYRGKIFFLYRKSTSSLYRKKIISFRYFFLYKKNNWWSDPIWGVGGPQEIRPQSDLRC